MNLRQAISGTIWAAILAIALQLVPVPALAHAGHTHHAADGVALAHHQHGAAVFHQKAVSRASQALFQPPSLSATPDGSVGSVYASPCTGGCCGAGAGCCGAALLGSTAELPDIGTAVGCDTLVDDRRSGIDPDGLARPPRTLAL